MKKGTWLAIGAYTLWGLLVFYWKALKHVPPLQLLAHRIFWSFLFVMGIILLTRQWNAFRKSINRKAVIIYVIAAVLIAVNWFTYVWAVGAGFVIETALGYFINPLLSVLLGVIFLREHLRLYQWIPILLAAAGVLYLTFVYGSLPWIALLLASTFALYGLIKKIAPLGALHGMTLETGLLFLPAMSYLVFTEVSGTAAFVHSPPTTNVLLIGAGMVTVIPLLLFAMAATRIQLSLIGIMQYISPSMQFLLGLLIYHEGFDIHRLVGFCCVWVGLLIFILEGTIFQRSKKLRLVEAANVTEG